MNPGPSSPASGTSQDERFPPALDPATAPLDDRDDAALTAAARAFASQLAFWTADGRFDSGVDWASFLPDFAASDPAAREAHAAGRAQQALFLTFLKLRRHLRTELDATTGRHLDFHFRDVLRMRPEPARADTAHLVLALKKSVRDVRVPEGTEFTTAAGLRYCAVSEMAARQVKLVRIRTIHRSADGRILHAPVADSGDGLGGELPADDPSWHPFGAGRTLPPATIGFAVSSPALLLGEGTRAITLRFELAFAGPPPADAALTAWLENHASAALSGAKAWLPAGACAATVATASGATRRVGLEWTLDGNAAAVTAYDPTVLEGGFDTIAPVMKVAFSGDAPSEVRNALATATVTGISIEVAVAGMKNVILENDHGRLDASKPFLPFGPQPRAGSSFYIGASEALAKHVRSAVLNITWAGVPANLATRYAAYKDGQGRAIVPSNSHFTARFQILRGGRFENLSAAAERLFDAADATRPVAIDSADEALGLSRISFADFTRRFSRGVASATLRLPFSDVAVTRPLATLAAAPALDFRSRLLLPALIRGGRLTAATREGFLRLVLDHGFGQDRYPSLLATALTHNSQPEHAGDKLPEPERPYLPEISEFTLDYRAATGTVDPNATTEAAFRDREIRFFHLHPFGQREEHRFIKRSVGADDPRVTLLPAFPDEGELLLGIEGLEPRQDVSLLFQVRDGSANPESTRREIRWSVLASNHWRPLAAGEIPEDSTASLLVSGIVRLLAPAASTDRNTLLEPGLVWLRATVDTRPDAVCRLLDIRPNAVAVTLGNPSAASHLAGVLPAGSIAAAVKPLRGVQAVSQPYPSFGGAPWEEEKPFRTRVAERLRHRGRAVSAWDYERIVLQAFPDIHRVKCLTHTRRDLSSAPGHVTLVVIPKSHGIPTATPRADLATLAAIEEMLAARVPSFVTVAAINPVFEPVELRFKVAFRSGLPFASYRGILSAEIERLLAPWSGGGGDEPGFGGVLHASALVARLDRLPYVGHLTDFELLHRPFGSDRPSAVQTATASTAGSILTSSGTHRIDPAP